MTGALPIKASDEEGEIFESRRLDLIAANQWPKDKPLPDPEQFLARELLDGTLKAMNYVPTKLDAKPK